MEMHITIEEMDLESFLKRNHFWKLNEWVWDRDSIVNIWGQNYHSLFFYQRLSQLSENSEPIVESEKKNDTIIKTIFTYLGNS